MKKITIYLLLFASITVNAQQNSIVGKLLDTAAKKKIAMATVTIFKANDTSIITYRLSNQDGEFKVGGLPLNLPMRMMVTHDGYEIVRTNFILTDSIKNIDFGEVPMFTSTKNIDDIIVIAERPPVIIKQDTIEFNATAFKTLPTALVEDLLRKLPGVQVDKEGNIFVNGIKVSRLMVDGKSFFGDDPKMATKNLPANVIDKIQVTDDKNAAAQNVDGDLTSVGKVINLTLKKSAKKGVFGRLYAGGGTKNRYETGGIVNFYKDTLQLSLLSFTNNINKAGFTISEVQGTGGFNRSGYNSMYSTRNGSREGFAINDIDFGGTEDGYVASNGIGFNLNHNPTKKLSWFAQYFYGHNNIYNKNINRTQQFIKDTTIFNNEDDLALTQRDKHNVGLGLNFDKDSVTNVVFRIGFNTTQNESKNVKGLSTSHNINGLLNKSNLINTAQFTNVYFNEELTLTKKGKKNKKRILVFSHAMNNRVIDRENILNNDIENIFPVVNNYLFNQKRNRFYNTFYVANALALTLPINKMFSFRSQLRHNLIGEKMDIGAFNKNSITGIYNNKISSLSNAYDRLLNRYQFTNSFIYKIKKWTFTPGINLTFLKVKNNFITSNTSINKDYFKILPNFLVQWNGFQLRYSKDLNPPGIDQVNPVDDVTNQLFIVKGNPNLLPPIRHNINLYGFINISKIKANVFGNIWGGITNNDVITTRFIDSKGVTTSFPINANNSTNLGTSFGFGQEFKNKQKFIFGYNINMWGQITNGRLVINSINSFVKNYAYSPYLSLTFNWNDVVEFRPDFSLNFNNTLYTDPGFKNINFVTKGITSELIVRWPKKIVWESKMVYTSNSSISFGLPKSNTLLNAGVTYLFLKGDRGLLKYSMFDIFNTNQNMYSWSRGNARYDGQGLVLNRYSMLTFTYNIRSLTAKKDKVGGNSLFRF